MRTWFRAPKVDAALLRKAAQFLATWTDGSVTACSIRINIRACLVADGHDVDEVDRAIKRLLR